MQCTFHRGVRMPKLLVPLPAPILEAEDDDSDTESLQLSALAPGANDPDGPSAHEWARECSFNREVVFVPPAHGRR